MKSIYLIKTICIVTVLFLCSNVHAQWSTSPDIDDTLNATVYDPLTFCSDGHGGAFFTWTQTFTGVRHDVIVNRIDSLGYLQFGDSGKIIHTDSAGQIASGAPNICDDGRGGCYIVYTNNRLSGHPIVCHHLNSLGNALWADTGIIVAQKFTNQYYQTGADLIDDGAKGVMMTFVTNGADTNTGLYAQRLDFNGNRKWGEHGKLVNKGSDERSPRLISDGSKGITILWPNYSYEGQGFSYSLRIARLNHDGQLKFATGSLKLNLTHNIGFGPTYRLILTKNKNYIATWNSDGLAQPIIYAQKISPSGNFLWGSNEITVRDTTGEVRYPNLVSDGSEGAYFDWIDGRKINVSYGLFAQHLNADGARQWAPQGLRIDSAATGNFPHLVRGANNTFNVFWMPSVDNRMHMQQIHNNGTILLPGLGTALATPGHVPFLYRTVLPVANNHQIIFIKTVNGKCFAKYVPFASGITLPRTVIDFTAVNNGNYNLLTWRPAEDANADYFSVERSDDGKNFQGIATVKTGDNLTDFGAYNYKDAALNSDVFYRLKQVGEDGKIMYSNIVLLRALNGSAFRIVPNPVANICTLYFEKVPERQSVLTITDANGRQVKQVTLTERQASVSINVSSLQPGVYFCTVNLNGRPSTQRIVVVR